VACNIVTRTGVKALRSFGERQEWALWLKGRPTRVYATAAKLNIEQHNKVDDEATIVLEYPDATTIIQASGNWRYGKGQVEGVRSERKLDR
jgi:predicted dehydrogenase